MSGIYISGLGAVSPAGWNVAALRDALAKESLLPWTEITLTPRNRPVQVMRAPSPNPRPPFLAHSRLRRTSAITQFAVAAAVEALGPRETASTQNIGVIVCVFSGCVNYSRRFYDEVLKDPATASPLIFPETVFNAPASHISAYLGSTAINYTLVGDAGTFLTGLATGAKWLLEGRAEECLVVGTEEIDWLSADAVRLFDRTKYVSEGAGAVLLRKNGPVRLEAVTDELFYHTSGKTAALAEMRTQLGESRPGALLIDGTSHEKGVSKEEHLLWRDWNGPRITPKKVLGEGLMASAAWQVVVAADSLMNHRASDALVSIAGFHQHAIGARLSIT